MIYLSGIRKIAFPSISTGVYAYPVKQAADITVRVVREFMDLHSGVLDEVVWALFDSDTKEAYDRALDAEI